MKYIFLFLSLLLIKHSLMAQDYSIGIRTQLGRTNAYDPYSVAIFGDRLGPTGSIDFGVQLNKTIEISKISFSTNLQILNRGTYQRDAFVYYNNVLIPHDVKHLREFLSLSGAVNYNFGNFYVSLGPSFDVSRRDKNWYYKEPVEYDVFTFPLDWKDRVFLGGLCAGGYEFWKQKTISLKSEVLVNVNGIKRYHPSTSARSYFYSVQFGLTLCYKLRDTRDKVS